LGRAHLEARIDMPVPRWPLTRAVDANVRILLPPAALFLVGLFRRFESFRARYDQAHLDAARTAIRERLGEAACDGVMSDALLVDNELRLRTVGRFKVRPVGSATPSEDELNLVRLVAALQAGSYRRAAECALHLDIMQSRTMLLLAERLAERLLGAGLVVTCASADEGAPIPVALHRRGSLGVVADNVPFEH
jgi:hypothetical protein